MDISIIVPVYKGNKYLNRILRSISRNANLIKDVSIELILVNDCPECTLKYDSRYIDGFEFHSINNVKNLGIQGARVEGLKQAKGEYVLFLDQDDEIYDKALFSQYQLVQGHDAVIANGYVEMPNGSKVKLFKNRRQQEKVNDIKYYFYIGNVIVSPGTTLLRRNIIPKVWSNNLLENNGADDWLLWTSFLLDHKKFIINKDMLYVHRYTGKNLSNNIENMLISSREALDILQSNSNVSEHFIKIHHRRLNMRATMNWNGKALSYLMNPDILVKLLAWKA